MRMALAIKRADRLTTCPMIVYSRRVALTNRATKDTPGGYADMADQAKRFHALNHIHGGHHAAGGGVVVRNRRQAKRR